MEKPPGLGYSFLDLLSGTMAAVVVLVVIFSLIKNPVPVPQLDEFILIHVEFKKPDTNAETMEAGVIATAPDGQQYAIMPGAPEANFRSFGLDSPLKEVRCWWGVGESAGGSSLFVEIPAPLKGRWLFEPYIVNAAPTANASGNKATVNSFKVWTKHGLLQPTEQQSQQPSVQGPPGAVLTPEDVHKLKAIVEIR